MPFRVCNGALAIFFSYRKLTSSPYDPARADYDTPFYDGNGDDHRVCVENKCSPQSAVNYVAQGMYSAHTGQSLDDALVLASSWCETQGKQVAIEYSREFCTEM